MKKLLLLAIFIAGFKIQAQQIEVRLGINNSYQLIKHKEKEWQYDKLINPGFSAGLNIDFPLQHNWSFSPGLFFNTKGYGTKVDVVPVGSTEPTTSFDLYHRLFYIDIPVVINKKISLNNSTELFVGAGPYLGFKLFACSKAGTNDCDDGRWISNRTQTLDFGLTAQTGIIFKKNFTVNFIYGYGLLNISKIKEETYKNRYMSLQLGYRFDL